MFSYKLRLLTPLMQYRVMIRSQEHKEAVNHMNELVENIPKIGETDSFKKHPLFLHYFAGSCDWYICEWDGENTFFGYVILGDLEMSEWGYIDREELLAVEKIAEGAFNLDFHCSHKTIEEALYASYPSYFTKYKDNADLKEGQEEVGTTEVKYCKWAHESQCSNVSSDVNSGECNGEVFSCPYYEVDVDDGN